MIDDLIHRIQEALINEHAELSGLLTETLPVLREHVELRQQYDVAAVAHLSVQKELDALRHEYDEEVRSNDIEETDLKQQVREAKLQIAELKITLDAQSELLKFHEDRAEEWRHNYLRYKEIAERLTDVIVPDLREQLRILRDPQTLSTP